MAGSPSRCAYSLPHDAEVPADHPVVNALLRAMEHPCDEVT